MSFTAKDPDFADRVTNSFQRQPFMSYIGAVLYKVAPGYCEVHVPFRKELTQQHNFFYGGIVGTVADNCAGYAAYTLMHPASSVLAVEFKLNLLSPAKGDLLIGKAHVLKNGRTLTVCRSDVFIVSGGTEKLCAAAQSTIIELHDTRDSTK